MYALTSSMKGATCRRFAHMVCKKTDVKVCRYSSHALMDMKLSNDLNKIRDRTPNLPFQASSIFFVNSRRNLNPHTRNLSTAAPSSVGDNTSATTTTTTAVLPLNDSGSSGGVARIGEVKKETKIETNVSVKINLNGSGVGDSDSGIPFLDEMLHQFASHGLFDVHVKANAKATSDIDDHHINEEVGMAIGTALKEALGDDDKKKGINRHGNFIVPLGDALIQVSLDLSGGGPYLGFPPYFGDDKGDDGTYGPLLVKHFFESLVNTSGMTLHIQKHSGWNSRHMIEATFKAFAGALRQATEYDPRRRPLLLDGTLPTSN